MEKTPSLKVMLVIWEVVEAEALPRSTPDLRAKKESSIELLGVAETKKDVVLGSCIACRGCILPSHPAARGSILGSPNYFFLDVAEIY